MPLRTYETLQRYVRHHAVRTLREMRAYRLDLAIGSSGTIRSLADVAARHFHKRPLQPDDVLTYAHLQQVVKLLAALSLERRYIWLTATTGLPKPRSYDPLSSLSTGRMQ